MSTAIIITSIICATVIVLFVINAIKDKREIRDKEELLQFFEELKESERE